LSLYNITFIDMKYTCDTVMTTDWWISW